MSFRIEEKIPVSPSDGGVLLKQLQAEGLKPLYPERCIYSIYFDTIDGRMFAESEEGVLPRKKIRLRHYPEEESLSSSLEIKISSIEGRFKTSQAVDEAHRKKLLRSGVFDNVYGVCLPFLHVRYNRQYFIKDETRITLDTGITYCSHKNLHNAHFESWNVFEIKAKYETSTDYLNTLISSPRKRFSKFSNGIAAISGFHRNGI